MHSIFLSKNKMNTIVYIDKCHAAFFRLRIILYLFFLGTQFCIQFIQCLTIHSNAIIRNFDQKTRLRSGYGNRNFSLIQFELDSMNDTVLKNRLQSQLRDHAVKNVIPVFFILFDFQMDSAAKTILLNLKIRCTVFQFFFNCNKILYLTDGITEEDCKCFCHICQIIKSCHDRLTTNPFQCIIKEMWIDLVLQCPVLCLPLRHIQCSRRRNDLVHMTCHTFKFW